MEGERGRDRTEEREGIGNGRVWGKTGGEEKGRKGRDREATPPGSCLYPLI